MNVTPLIIGAIGILIGVLFIVFRKPINRAQTKNLEGVGDHAAPVVRALQGGKFAVLQGCGFILFGAVAVFVAFFPPLSQGADVHPSNESGFSAMAIFGLVLLLFGVLCFAYFFSFRRRRSQTPPDAQTPSNAWTAFAPTGRSAGLGFIAAGVALIAIDLFVQ